tara:strand:+ start:4949 stop:5992 length:1044 start_codon:yes stop_codon:yes gene_type:complete
MGSNLEATKISSSEKILKSSHINNLVAQIEEFLNVGISTSSFAEPKDHDHVPIPANSSWALARDETGPGYTEDGTPTGRFSSGFKTDGYIDKKHIFKPEFYGAPAPRMEAVSGQIHHRGTGSSNKEAIIFSPSTTGGSFEIVPGTAARVKIRDEAVAFVTASFFCFELGGVQFPKAIAEDKDFSTDQSRHGGQSFLAGTIGLAIQGKEGMTSDVFGSTHRRVYTSLFSPRATVGPTAGESNFVNNGRLLFHMMGRHQHNITKRIFLRPGVYDIGIAFKAQENPQKLFSHCDLRKDERMGWGHVQKSKNVFFKSKNLNIDIQYRSRKTPESEGMEPWRWENEFDDQRF